MEELISKLQHAYPSFSFLAGDSAQWSFERQEIVYLSEDNDETIWTLLHELGHGVLGHASYSTDVDLLKKEVGAWEKAREIATGFRISIEEGHIEDCLDTYRDWLHKRSTCPDCASQGVQRSEKLYDCFNCQATWKVGKNRLCRPYRLKKARTAI